MKTIKLTPEEAKLIRDILIRYEDNNFDGMNKFAQSTVDKVIELLN